ncbi:hypothetical protein HK102_010646, partial [Quaeritorhiza haematococci]
KKYLKIQASTIRGVGKGLFAVNPNAEQPVFQKGDIILDYIGDFIPVRETDCRYGDKTAVYTLRKNRSTDIDAACKRGVAAMANSKPGSNNAYFGFAGRGSN